MAAPCAQWRGERGTPLLAPLLANAVSWYARRGCLFAVKLPGLGQAVREWANPETRLAAARCRPVQFSSNQGKKQPVHAVMASKGGQDGGNGSAAAAAPPDYFGYTFSIENEDHTLANSLRFFLNKK